MEQALPAFGLHFDADALQRAVPAMTAEPLRDSAVRFAGRLRALAADLAESDIDAALRLAEAYGSFLAHNFVGIPADSALEQQLALRLTSSLKAKTGDKLGVTAHLVTTAYPWGGHTRVVERLLAAGLGDGLIVLDPLPKALLERFPKDKPVIQLGRESSGALLVARIVEAGLRFDNIILHIHPEDIYSASAAILLAKAGKRIHFYNHADHAFSFGYSSAENVFEIGKYGWLRGSARGIERRQSFAGIPIPALSLLPKPSSNVSRFVFAGSPSKFIPFLEYSVPEFINQLAQTFHDRVAITVIGPGGRESHWAALTPAARRLVTFTPTLSHGAYLDLLSRHNAYIDSFPKPNATGLAEVVAAGMPAFGLDLMAGYSYSDTLRSHSVPDLTAAVAAYSTDRASGRFEFEEIRQQVIREQSAGACAQRISQVIADKSPVPLPAEFFGMNCREDFHERFWLSIGKVNLDFECLVRLGASDLRAIAGAMGDFRHYCSSPELARSAAKVLLGESGRSSYRRMSRVLTLGRRQG